MSIDKIRKGMLLIIEKTEAETYNLDLDNDTGIETIGAFKDIKSIEKYIQNVKDTSYHLIDSYDDEYDTSEDHSLSDDLIVYELVPRYIIERKLVITDLNKSTTTSSSVKKTEIDLYED